MIGQKRVDGLWQALMSVWFLGRHHSRLALPEDAGRESHPENSAARAPEPAVLLEVNPALARVELEARGLFGEFASEWMATPSRFLDGIAPAELAASPDGARVVLHVLRRAHTGFRTGGAIPGTRRPNAH
jgi:Protein of unknown function (DUF2384)